MSETSSRESALPGTDVMAELMIPLLGRRVVFRSNDSRVLRLFEESFGLWTRLVPGGGVNPTATVTVEVVPGDVGSLEVDYALDDPDRLEVSGDGLTGMADCDRADAEARIAVAWLDEPATLRYLILEALTLFLVTGPNRLPVHASAVTRDGTALLLIGPSGTGKSTVAHAALSAGFQVLAEDVVYVEPGDPPKIWGGVSRLYLPEDASGPMVGRRGEASLLPNGKTKIVVRLPEGASPAVPLVHCVLCFMTRGSGEVSWRPLEIAETERLIAAPAEGGFHLFEEATRGQLTRIASRGAFLLELAADPAEAVVALDEIFGMVIGQGGF